MNAANFAPGLERAFARASEERADVAVHVEGRLPAWLRGSWIMNGPARFARAGQAFDHWLDGDGMVAAVRFDDEGPRHAARYVRTRRLAEEEEAGRALYRAFGPRFTGDRLLHGVTLASPGNVAVLPFAGRLLAFGEQGEPDELDPLTLETRGAFGFGGAVGPLTPFSAHARVDAASGELWNFGIAYAAARPQLNVFRFDREGRQLLRRRLPLDAPRSLHDFALGPRHAAFFLGPHVLDMAVLSEGGTLLEALAWRPELGSRLLVVSRPDAQPLAEIALPPAYSLHAIQLFEHPERAQTLVLDLIELDEPVYPHYRLATLFEDVGPGRPVRWTIDLRERRVVERQAVAYERAPDFVTVDPRAFGRGSDDFWLLGIGAAGRRGRKFFDQLVHGSWDRPASPVVWQAPAGTYLAGEPAFASGAQESVVLVPLYETGPDRSALAVFDARDVAAGPRAVVRLPQPLYLGFHAAFAPEHRGNSGGEA
ncbi:MAG: carotenoid oxygenase family protein [Vicinamibacteria bacterium]|nr:carotenoid oxygenase family protein [Vicinamibacteria bacterium]